MRVFIENESGSNVKHYHDEKTLEPKGSSRVSRAYPFPYGFVIETTAADGDNVDCFVLTAQPLRTGQIVECEAVGLMEQIEDGEEDHKILACVPGEAPHVDETTQQLLSEFVTHVFDHIPGKRIAVGAFRDRAAALRHLDAHTSR